MRRVRSAGGLTIVGITGYRHNYAPFEALAGNATTLVDKFDLLLTYKTLSPQARTIIIDAVNQVPANERRERVKMALMLFEIAPDYKIQR